MRLVTRPIVLTAALVVAAIAAPFAQQRTEPAARPQAVAQATASPSLFVIISIDQMRGDYVTRYGHQWTRGLRRLIDGGARFTRTVYPYFNTVTCAGHATIGTGTFPGTHGMVLNQWFDRTASGTTNCTDDTTVTPLIYGDGPAPAKSNSGARLLVPTFADEMRAQASPAPRVAAVSLKARSAIGLAGHGGDVVLWYDSGRFLSSTAFSPTRTPFVDAYTTQHPIRADFGRTWTKSLPDAAYLFEDEGLGEKLVGRTQSFPYQMTGRNNAVDASFYTSWEYSPLADEYVGALAMESVRALKLGQEAPRRDVLAVSFSVLDLIGHAYGPRSHEVQDVLVRLDATIGRLLETLDAEVGRGRYVVGLTGDHGVSPIPEQMSALGIDAGRISLPAVRTAVDQALVPFFGDGKYVASVLYTDLYFLPGVWDRLRAAPEAMTAVLDAIRGVAGVSAVYRSDELEARRGSGDPVATAMAVGFFAGRSGDILIAPRSYWISSTSVATHGTMYEYDARVPLIFYGAPFAPGEYTAAATPADLVKTLAHVAGITLPRADGRVRGEALVSQIPVPAGR
ncbi:MAG: alkaline phosphatase family protein [Acidobacteria bacterium]|nr:alkaline phosphatase family protein [Acidobacteriota bacterium]